MIGFFVVATNHKSGMVIWSLKWSQWKPQKV